MGKKFPEEAGASVRSIERCFDILDLIVQRPGGVSLTEISRNLEIPKSTALIITRTLVKRGLLTMGTQDKLYRIGPSFHRFALHAPKAVSLKTLAHSLMQTLVNETGETVSLAAIDSSAVYYIDRVLSNQPIHYRAQIGVPSPLHCTASGKLFLAHMSAAEAKAILERGSTKFTKNTIVRQQAMTKELATIRRRGYALSIGEFHPEVIGVAAPIINSSGEVIASVGVSGPRGRMKRKLPQISLELVKVAKAISNEVARAGDNVRVFEGPNEVPVSAPPIRLANSKASPRSTSIRSQGDYRLGG